MKRSFALVSILSIILSPVTASAADDAFTPAWTDLGPGPIRSNAVNESVNVEGMSSTNNPTAGAITKVLVDPLNTNIIYAGAVNGGIWKTTDNGSTWNYLTDRLSSLSIGAMNFDSTDTTNRTIIAGTGRQSAFKFTSGPLTGIQYSTDGGSSWTEMGQAALNGKDITGVAARGTVMMAAVRNMDTPLTTVGLYRSTDGGASFSNSVTGLPVGNIQNLAGDPTNSSRFYLSVVNGNDTTTGIYRSDDAGANWTLVRAVTGLKAGGSAKADGRILLSVGAEGVLIAQVQQGTDRLDILRTANQGGSWAELGKPSVDGFAGIFPGNQPEVHGAVIADPNNANIVYTAGDRQYMITNSAIGAKQWSIPIFRGEYNPTTTLTTWTYITNDNTLSGSAPHADARTFFIDSNGRLLFGGDGGLNAYLYPGTVKQYDWIPVMNSLRTAEMTQSFWNSVTHTVSGSAQDIGAYYQFPGQKGTYDWSSTSGGDGGPGPVNVISKGPGTSVVYTSSQNLGGFSRFEVGTTDDAAKASKTLTVLQPYFMNSGSKVYVAGENAGYMSFLSTVTLNRTDPRKMAIGGYNLFIGTDDLTKSTLTPFEFQVTSILPGTGNLPTNNSIGSLAYGTNSSGANVKATALLAGAGNFFKTSDPGYLYYTSDAGTVNMTNLGAYSGKYVYSAIFDERDGNRFYVADGASVWRSTNTGAGFSTINGNLPSNLVDRRGLAFASNNGVNALFVGGVSNTANGSGVYVSRYSSDTSADSATPTWSSFGGSLANAPVFGISYDTTDDVLLVNLLGRGAWVVYDMTSYFPEATTLAFGKANNNSSPASSLMTDGTLVGGGSFSRGVTKSGTGTLFMSGKSNYSGTTTISSGVLSIASTESLPGWNTDGKYTVASGAALAVGNNVSEASVGAKGSAGTILNTTNFASGSSIGFDTSASDRTYASLIADTVNGALGLVKIGLNTLTLTGSNSYTGVTTITGGALSASSINNGGVDGNIGAATAAASNLVLDGGTLRYTGATTATDRAFTITSGKTGTIDVSTAGSTLTISGASAATSGALTKAGSGTLLLGGANSYTGATTVNAGTLQGGIADQAFGIGSAMTVASSGTLDLGGFNETIGSLSGAGTVTNSSGAKTLTVGDDNSTSFSGVIQNGAGSTSLAKQGTGTLSLSGTNIYSGGTTISSGIISIANTGSLPGWNTNGKYSVASGTALAVGNGVSEASVGANGSAGTILNTTNFASGANIGFDTSLGDRTYGSIIGDTVNGALGLVKIGANMLTLSMLNTYTGITTILDGTISAGTIGNGGVAGNIGKATSAAANLVFDGGILKYTGATASTDRAFTIVALSTATIDVSTSGSVLTISGAVPDTTGNLIKAGAGTLLMSGINAYKGSTTVNAGTLQAGVAGQAFGNNSSVTLNNKDSGGLNLNDFDNTIGPLNGVANSTVKLGSATLSITTGSTAGNYSGVISGTGKLTTLGTGTQILTGANLYSGLTTISGTSTLQIGDSGVSGGATGTLGTGFVTNNSILKFSRSNNLTVTNAISGTGALRQEGTGILTLNSVNIYTGVTTVSSGILSIANTASLPGWNTNGKFSVASGAALAVCSGVSDAEIVTLSGTTNFSEGANLGFDTTNSDRTYTNAIGDSSSGKMGIMKINDNTLTLSGLNTYTGITTISGGTLSVNSINNGGVAGNMGQATNAAANLVLDGGTLKFTGGSESTDRGFTINSGKTGTIDVSTFGNTLTLSGAAASSSGNLTKAGSGILLLSGANQYTGATTVNAGTLKAGVDTVTDTSGAFGVGSAVTVAGAGTLDLNGFDETIGSLSGSGTVTNFGASKKLTVGDASSTSFSGAIQDGIGAISLTKQGIGTLNLGGTNTYTGATTVNAGFLQAGKATKAFGDKSAVTLNNTDGGGLDLNGFDNTIGSLNGGSESKVILGAGTLTTGVGTSDKYEGVISGTGGLTTVSTGTQILTGTNLYSGTTTISGTSTLQIGDGGTTGTLGTGAVTNNSFLSFNRTDSLSVSNVISGSGMLKQDGTGILTLSGSNLYGGGTRISSGTIKVSSSSALGTGSVTNNSILDIDSTTLNIGGDYSQGAAATLKVAVSGTSSGSIAATGKATAASGSAVTLNVSNYVPNNQTYKIIGGAAGGDIKAPVITTPGYNNALFTATTVGDDLVLTASRGASNGFAADVAPGNPNASAAGTVLDGISNPSGDMQTVLNTLDGLSDSEVNSSLDSMVPQVDAGIMNTSTTSLNNFVGVAIDRVENVLTLAKIADTATTGMSAGDEAKLSGAWGKGYGSYLTQGTRNGVAGYDAWNAGTAIGMDHLFWNCLTLGLSGGYAYGNVDSDVNNAGTNINSSQTTIYGGYTDQNLPYFIDASGSFAYNWYNGTRDVNVGPAINRTANASYVGQQYGAYIGAGYKFNVTKNVELTPLVSLQYNHLQLGSYTETEAGALNLSVASQGYDQLQSGLGARIASPVKCKWGTFTPEAHGKWFYDFIGDAFTSTSNFNGGGGDFSSNGCKPALNSFNAGGQLIFDFKNDVSVIGNCDTEMKDQFFGIFGSLTLRYDF